jgi:flagellar secretion chaperone FliS
VLNDAVLKRAAGGPTGAQRAYGQYQRAQVETSSPGQLVVLLYTGCLKFAQKGRLALEGSDFEAARVNLLRAQDIVAELMGGLNLDAGEIAGNLLRLYEYMYQRLVVANVKRDAAAASEVEEMIRSLLPAWEEAVKKQSGVGTGGGTTGPAGLQPGKSVSLNG